MRKLLFLLGAGILGYYFLRDLTHGTLTFFGALPLLILIAVLLVLVFAALLTMIGAKAGKHAPTPAQPEAPAPPRLPQRQQAVAGLNADIGNAQKNTWARTSDGELEAFFREPDNLYPGMRVSSIIYAVGPCDSEDDWDRGHWVYEWSRPALRIRVTTDAGAVIEAGLMDCRLPARLFSEKPKEILWRRADHDPALSPVVA
jgi:hypothetical protein